MPTSLAERLLRWCARRMAKQGYYMEYTQTAVWGEYRKVDGPAREKDWT